MILNHPECHRGVIGVYGPPEKRDKIIITRERGDWVWRYKRAGERLYVWIGQVSRFANPCEEIKIANLVADIY